MVLFRGCRTPPCRPWSTYGLAGAAQTPEDRRAIAIALLDDLFVQYSYRFSRREKRTEVSRRMTWLGLGIIGLPTLLVFLWPILVLVFYSGVAEQQEGQSYEAASEILWA